MAEVKVVDLNTKYRDIVILDEYNGTYSLIAGQAGDNKNFWKMAKYKTKNGYTDKDMPVKIVLGGLDQAQTTLQELLEHFNGGTPF